MESCFGEYITNEYGLLKQILSYLKPCDLRNARHVCREWSSAVESLLDKNAVSLTGGDGQTKYTDLSKPILPALVIHQNIPYLRKPGERPEQCKICKQHFFLCPCKVSASDTVFVSLDSYRLQQNLRDFPSFYSFWQEFSALMLPSSTQIQVSTFCAESKATLFKEQVTDDVVSLCTGGPEPIKCLLVISKTTSSSSRKKWVINLLNQIVNRQGVTFAVGGGDIRDVMCKTGFDFTQNRWKKPGLLLITLRGENVTAHSDILSGLNRNLIENFMQEMASRVGPIPEGGSRLAFVAQCVERAGVEVEKWENYSFKKAFPSVPLFGFRAYGEYGIRSCSSGDDEQRFTSKRMKMNFDRSQTSSFLLLTFNKI